MERNKVIVVLGVSGSGKSTIGKKLAHALEIPFYDADDFHPQSNIDKMKSGQPLNDEDRYPWLKKLSEEIRSWNKKEGGVLACSALKESYRKILETHTTVDWVFLTGSFETIFERMKNRNHFMKADMLQSQFDALEAPEYGYHVDVRINPRRIVESIIKRFGYA
ncbi:gluconokinase [Aureisphaera galaxeae]|uniref:gluconokinase n=1 Tax=Aureisphaera galaxeae TaxID=1538023 RepID=UPI0023509C04|nr:gluconokinase [Aureisphaera galaxeae]MDC8004231.1 gluconokinase [Aureisphaera galaxeae]